MTDIRYAVRLHAHDGTVETDRVDGDPRLDGAPWAVIFTVAAALGGQPPWTTTWMRYGIVRGEWALAAEVDLAERRFQPAAPWTVLTPADMTAARHLRAFLSQAPDDRPPTPAEELGDWPTDCTTIVLRPSGRGWSAAIGVGSTTHTAGTAQTLDEAEVIARDHLARRVAREQARAVAFAGASAAAAVRGEPPTPLVVVAGAGENGWDAYARAAAARAAQTPLGLLCADHERRQADAEAALGW